MTRLQPVRGAHKRALWLEEALAAEPDAELVEPFSGKLTTDVCIIGGGYTGMWTALRIKELDPSVDVVILEADICGSGASGRNGGFASTWWLKLPALIEKYGDEEGERLARKCGEAISAIANLCDEYGIDADLRQEGILVTATAPAQIDRWRDAVALVQARGYDTFTEMSPAEVARMSGSPVHLAGILDRNGARVQPALLARGMRKAALAKGVKIYEHTPATEILRGRPPVVRTPLGAVIADKVVLATNAWMCSLPEIRRAVLPMSSDMLATAPIPERLQEIGWTSGRPVGDSHMMVHYYRTTRDGRIAFGKGGCSHTFMGQIGPELEDPGARVKRTVRSFHHIYPMLADVPITHTWTGPIDRSETNSLFFGHLDGTPDIIYGVGYSGTGVAPSYVGGHVLASTALDRRDEWQESPINRGPSSLYPYDPIRYFGGNIVRQAVLQNEADLNANRDSSQVVQALLQFVPSGLRAKPKQEA
ncbi:MAG: FAD-dependent oxidoreductase [Thermomicrobiales bacterium]